ncbi:MAG: type II secretion system F family protein [Deltaproteobacteria bacterium]|nr:type II secretion system F family protein [Deltaproteobacteria bacterium]
MALYSYHATDSSGGSINGTMDGPDEGAIVSRLQDLGYLPIKVERTADSGLSKSEKPFFFFRKTSSREVAAFTHELGSLLDAGMPLDKSLSTLSEVEENPAFRKIIIDLYSSIQSGHTLADSLESHPTVFSPVYVNSIRAGEAGGALEIVLERLIKFMEDAEKLKEDITSALMYPLLLTVAGSAAVIVMLVFVIPRFSLIFADAGAAMPLSTQVLFLFSGFFLTYWWAPLIAAVFIGFQTRRRLRTEAGRLAFDKLKLKLPVLGPVLRKVVISRFSRTLGTLMQGGLPVLEALRISVNTMGNSMMFKEMRPVIEGVKSGRGIALPLKETNSFPPLAVHMLKVGEETGRLDEMLLRLADKYDRDISTSIKRFLTLLEPAIILLMAVFVGFIVISLLLAIFSLNDMPL